MGKATCWGIAGAGGISADFTRAVQLLQSDEHQVQSVAARQLSRAEDFARVHGIPRAYGSYQELAHDNDIDIIYVGVIRSQHLPVCKLMLSNGKNVLCEKPLAMNSREAKELFELAQEKGVFIMEGMWSRCFPAYKRLQEELDKKTLGDIKLLQIDIGLPVIHTDSHSKKEWGAGAFLGFGVYGVQLATMLYDERPQRISGTGVMIDTGVDVADSVTLLYSAGQIAQINVHLGCELSNCATIYGTKGKAQLANVWCPEKLVLLGETLMFPTPKIHPMRYVNTGGLSYEAQSVRECLQQGLKENPLMPHRHTLIDMDIIDEVRRQVGVIYEQDHE